MKKLIVITGATAVGKTALCTELAAYFDTEIISADSRQFYKEMSIGTAKPTQEEMTFVSENNMSKIIKHHFIDSHSIQNPLSAGQFEKEALSSIDNLFKQRNKENDILILTGGSGLFIQAICDGFDEMPTIDSKFREKLNQELEQNGLKSLVAELQKKDKEYAAEADLNNPQRVIRALEIIRSTGKTYSEFRKLNSQNKEKAKQKRKQKLGFATIKIMLDRPREELYERINKRVLLMIENGLVAEVKSLQSYAHLSPLKTVGYQELFDYFDNKIDLETAISNIQQNTRRFAKRQLTWFRKDTEYIWFDISKPNYKEKIIDFIETLDN
ncbi:tRNA isopentenyltransferase MiaA [Bernardetia litoralis DSM 6794]|uniref:tRNA dimethylallyltransferase n=1 Tax=Bernardetia litoralis (strain ATCC 23117 / DSM 6794 / NBRC 15988 / NCIMB 1366 / Fx l1 / Sio-4) TaxID=880071 RepID=I4AGA2_BERLS|nr:tRNA (adenosine(37)-N6)-dimethylallyltransferase MiaA [Bernardetia litoralis]AFM02987.1 tRNA isopentenyltransferase MiaA [Bernardetia litoralis DSM 6794]